MTDSIFSRPLVAGVATFAVATTLTSGIALAACAGTPTLVALSGLIGPPSITATESSTDQALELIRKRREEASGSCPAGFTRSGGNCVPSGAPVAASQVVAQAPAAAAPAAPPPVSTTTTTTVGQAAAQAASPPAAGPQPKRPPAAKGPAAAPAPVQVQQVAQVPVARPVAGYRGGSIKDGGYDVPMPGTIRTHGAWLEGYYDYEKHKNLNPPGGPENNPTRKLTTTGVVAGADIGQFTTGHHVHGFQVGILGGHSIARARFTDTTSLRTDDADTQLTRSTNQRQDVEGSFAGAYATMVHGRFSADAVVKVDFYDIEQTSLDTRIGCGGTPISRFDVASGTNVAIASNLNYRFDLSNSHYIEPTIGMRYTHVDYGSGAGVLGFRDGDIFRIQGGLRVGMRHFGPTGWLWDTSLTGLLYSDVSMSGLVVPAVTASNGTVIPATPLVDEGKLRVMGVLESRVEVGNGYTFYGAAEVRGGEDVVGFGGRAGVRLRW